jgi:alkylhydroperoxidase family enzyme
MKSVEPLSLEDVAKDPELAEVFASRLARTGYVSNSLRVMARVPELVRAADGLVNATFFSGAVPTGLKMLMFLMFSSRWGCQYCQAHALVNVQKQGVPDAQIEQLWDFTTSDAFDTRERAALLLARDAALAGTVTEVHYCWPARALRRRGDRRTRRCALGRRVPQYVELDDGDRTRATPYRTR